MQKSTHTESHHLSKGKREKKTKRIIGLSALVLVLLLAVQQINRSQLLAFASSLHDGGTTISGSTLLNAATSLAGQTQLESASVTADVSADFGSRQNRAHPIPSQLLGIGGIDMNIALNNNGGKYVPEAGFHLTKLGDYDYMSEIFPSSASMSTPSKQNWSKLDGQLALAKTYHLQPMITLAYTPSWLQPQNQSPSQPNPCSTYSPPYNPASVKPMYLDNGHDVGTQTWGKLAALIVAHVDKNFPQSHALYEIWNQPDGGNFLCVPKGDNNADADRFSAYKAIFAAAAPLMRQQANKDGISSKIGGPALVYALQSHLALYLPGMLNDPSIYPYIDFISYHRYMYGKSFNGGGNSLVSNAQDPLLGVASEYEQVAKAVRAGKQKNASHTPIYLDEYNMNPCEPGVCRNDPTYAPLDQGLFVTDLLNTVNDKNSKYGAAGSIPAGLAYYTWFTPMGNLCMFGVIDAKMDCGKQGSPLQPYPQFYAYELLGGANYLDITNGAYVANVAAAKSSGVFVTAFYTKTQDCIVIVNTTGTNYPSFKVLAQNPGTLSTSHANLYTVKVSLNNPAGSISTKQVNLTKGQNGASVTVNLPPLTMIGISFNV